MKYITREGKQIEEETSQDRLLEYIYTKALGRILFKPLVSPTTSVLMGKLLSTRFSALFIPKFIKYAGIDMSDYEETHYSSYNDFFTRKLAIGRRTIQGNEYTLTSPCDGKASVYPIGKKTIFSVKHTDYSLRSLLRSKKLADRYEGGYAVILRLTVDDCHRYCYCTSGCKSKNYYIQGIFHTVNPIANDYAPIYKENAREYTVIHSDTLGDIVQMEVGALGVGKIVNHDEKGLVKRGDEKGYFEFGGSTIILLVQRNALQIREDLIQNTEDGYETKILQGDILGQSK